MNLTALFAKDAALNDLSWMETDGLARRGEPYLSLEGVKNPNNVKPQLEMEWGLGGPNVDLDEPAGVVQRNLPEDAEGDAGGAIVFARDMQNRGFRASQIIKALKVKYAVSTLKKAEAGLRDQFSMDGVVGRIAIDGRGYRNCQEALKAAANSPYKRFLKYVIGCECGDPHCIPVSDAPFSQFDSSGNGIDDFFSASAEPKKAMVSHCRTSMLKILSSQGDLDQSELDSTMVEMMNTTGMPSGVAASVKSLTCSNLHKVRNAFRIMDIQKDRAESAKYAGKVETAEFKLKKADYEVELGGLPLEDLEVDPVNYSLQQEIEPEDAYVTNFDGPNTLPAYLDDVEVGENPDLSQIPLEMTDETNPSEMEFTDIPAEPQMVVDERPGELGIEFGQSDMFDVSMDGSPEPEFVDTDIIDLEDTGELPADLDVDMRQNMTI